jgi:hypothetical protein
MGMFLTQTKTSTSNIKEIIPVYFSNFAGMFVLWILLASRGQVVPKAFLTPGSMQ